MESKQLNRRIMLHPNNNNKPLFRFISFDIFIDPAMLLVHNVIQLETQGEDRVHLSTSTVGCVRCVRLPQPVPCAEC